jgi:hypothetical protein
MSSRHATTESPPPRIVRTALLAYSLVVCVLHFGGLEYQIYTAVWWWDLLTHFLSGIGVAAWLSVVRFGPFEPTQVLVLSMAVFAIGVGFEVYEYLFKEFYVDWTLRYYAVDTAVDLLVDGLGAATFAVWYRIRSAVGDHDAAVPTSSQ